MIVRHDMRLQDPFKLACGGSSGMVLPGTGEVWECGGNGEGQLGIGSRSSQSLPVKMSTVPAGRKVIDVFCGYSSTLVLLDGGELWVCGSGESGQLGTGHEDDETWCVTASTIPAGRTVKSGDGGDKHSMVILDDGTLWGCGNNDNGRLGNGNDDEHASFVRATTVPAGRTVKSVSCGDANTLILLDNNEVWGCGYGAYGRLGNGNMSSQWNFIKASTLPSGITIKKLVCGHEYTTVLFANGELWACGGASYGQLGNGGESDSASFVKVSLPEGRRAISLDCGDRHTMAILDNGELWGWGQGDQGQLGNGGTTQRNLSPVKATTVPAGRRVLDVACGAFFTLIRLDTGEVWGCGDNGAGQLGIGTASSVNSSFVKMTQAWKA